ncbi:hypothetical protein [Campylobacter concisus]|nr:hypothetical protein [Campylobacter concisus]
MSLVLKTLQPTQGIYFLTAQIHNSPCFYSLNLAQDTNLLAEFGS